MWLAYHQRMVDVVFAKAFQRHVDCPAASIDGVTIGEVLDAYFADHPLVRSYVLDNGGAIRKHVAVFHNDELISDRTNLSGDVGDGDRIHVFQALSGG